MISYFLFRPEHGLLAQLVEHIVHIDGVTGSSPVQTTRKTHPKRVGLLRVVHSGLSPVTAGDVNTSTGERNR